jgi:hypothetical protein
VMTARRTGFPLRTSMFASPVTNTIVYIMYTMVSTTDQ